MTYKEARIFFTLMIGALIQYSEFLSARDGIKYEFAIDWTRRCIKCPVGKKKSAHKIVLAVDMNLYINGKYTKSTKAHKPFGKFWKNLHPDAVWGGDFKDGNHYSLRFWGRA